MQRTQFSTSHQTALLAALIATAVGAGCSGNGDGGTAADVAAPTSADTAKAATPASATKAAAAVADFEGTMQQVVISLNADAVRKVAGSTDLKTVLALSPDRLIKAVHEGEVEAETISKAILEVDGRKGRYQTDGEPSYTILDGEQMASFTVMPEDRMIVTMRGAQLADADAEPVDLGAEKVGTSEIRGFATTGYRFEFMDNITTVWLSEELESQTGAFFNIWTALNPLGEFMGVGEGAPVRTVTVSPDSLAGNATFMPAYTVTEFYNVKSGAIAEDRMVLPDGYQQLDMADMGREAQ